MGRREFWVFAEPRKVLDTRIQGRATFFGLRAEIG